RPRDARAVVDALAGIRATGEFSAPRATTRPPALTGTERRTTCLVLARVARSELVSAVFGGRRDEAGPAALATVVEPFGGKLDRLADGSALVAVAGAGAPTDLAARAARCALRLRRLLPDEPIALVVGRGVGSARWTMGDAIDRGVSLLARPMTDE